MKRVSESTLWTVVWYAGLEGPCTWQESCWFMVNHWKCVSSTICFEVVRLWAGTNMDSSPSSRVLTRVSTDSLKLLIIWWLRYNISGLNGPQHEVSWRLRNRKHVPCFYRVVVWIGCLLYFGAKGATKWSQLTFKKQKTCTVFLSSYGLNLLAFNHECRSLIGYSLSILW